MPARTRAAGYRWEKLVRLAIATYGDVCHLCGHGGARQADHLEPQTERPDLIFVLSNLRPAHGTPNNRCPVCNANCNQLRGGYSIERAKRIIAERYPVKGAHERPEPRPEGRVWLAALPAHALRAPARRLVRRRGLVLGGGLQLQDPDRPLAVRADLPLAPYAVIGVSQPGCLVVVDMTQLVHGVPASGSGRTAPPPLRRPATTAWRRLPR